MIIIMIIVKLLPKLTVGMSSIGVRLFRLCNVPIVTNGMFPRPQLSNAIRKHSTIAIRDSVKYNKK